MPFTHGQSINMFGDTIDLNMVTQRVGIEDQFLHNSYTNGTFPRRTGALPASDPKSWPEPLGPFRPGGKLSSLGS